MDRLEDLLSEFLRNPGVGTTSADIAEDLIPLGELESLPLQGGMWAVGEGVMVPLLGRKFVEVEAPLVESETVSGQGVSHIVALAGHVLKLAVELCDHGEQVLLSCRAWV